MSFNFLPNTALATISIDKDNIFTYAQTYNGEIAQIKGKVNGSSYEVIGDQAGIDITKSSAGDTAAKRFTPLAAVQSTMGDYNVHWLFYVDNNNYLRDAYSHDNSQWSEGRLYQQGKWQCASYSNLAAIKLTNYLSLDFVSLYFQDYTATGNVRVVSYNPTAGWQEGNPPLDDPPLYGTSLAVVRPEPGIEVVHYGEDTDTQDPVVFFQYDKLELGSSQSQGKNDYATYNINDKTITLSAHAALAAVDDGTNFWAFYTADNNAVFRMRVDKNGAIIQPRPVDLGGGITPIPGSSLAAAFVKDGTTDKVVLFYLLHYEDIKQTTQEVNVFASVLTNTSASDADSWSSGARVCLTADS
ncbi:hypothetical protein QBC35DRAFT_556322 [Podospora australis]|uniref:Fucose-specific lectin n=1 Tax=Podospora australis TaxID=1536484 RepID=A0AAN6WP06_9PEZI|nr:hypothetical protein QBC35DRAFT_556322 [Podospora australis]